MPLTCGMLYCFGLDVSDVRSEINELILGENDFGTAMIYDGTPEFVC